MIDKVNNGYQIHCDNCPDSIYIPHARNFKEVHEEAKSSGWINRQVDGEWMNFCSEECYKERKNV